MEEVPDHKVTDAEGEGTAVPRSDAAMSQSDAEGSAPPPADADEQSEPENAGYQPKPGTLAAEALPLADPDQPDTKITIAQLKEKIMADTPENEMNKAANNAASKITDAMNEVQTRSRVAYEKSTEAVGEMSEFAKGNVEAMVESSKIVASGLQELGRTYAEEARSAYEQMSSDIKDIAAIKSPTELFQLQSKIMRRNFDMLVATSTKNSEAVMKLANEAFQPLSGRVDAAAEKASKIS